MGIKEGLFQRIRAIGGGGLLVQYSGDTAYYKHTLATFDFTGFKKTVEDEGDRVFLRFSGFDSNVYGIRIDTNGREYYRMNKADLTIQASNLITPADIGESAGEFAGTSFGADGRVYLNLYVVDNGLFIRTVVLNGDTLEIIRNERTVEVLEDGNSINNVAVHAPFCDGEFVYFLYGYDGGPEDFEDFSEIGTFVAKIRASDLQLVDSVFVDTFRFSTFDDPIGLSISVLGSQESFYLTGAANISTNYEQLRLYRVDTSSMASASSVILIDDVQGDSLPDSITGDADGNIYVLYLDGTSNDERFIKSFDSVLSDRWTAGPFVDFINDIAFIESGIIADTREQFRRYALDTGDLLQSVGSYDDKLISSKIVTTAPYAQRIGLPIDPS